MSLDVVTVVGVDVGVVGVNLECGLVVIGGFYEVTLSHEDITVVGVDVGVVGVNLP